MNVELADTLWTRSAGHALSAKVLLEEARLHAKESGAKDIDQAVFNGRYSASIHLLIGYAYELSLKAAFLLHGGQPQEMQREIGHDLVRALNKAEERGFKSAVDNLRWVIERIRDPHQTHQFRYGGRDTFEMAALESSFPRLEQLVNEVCNLIEAILPKAEPGEG